MPQHPQKYTRILSIDGGGIRAIIAGQILTVLENKLIERSGRPETRLVDYFDLIAGAGSGALLACGLLSPVKPHNPTPRFRAQQLTELFLQFGGKIFNESLDHKILTFGGLLDEKYTADDLERVLMDYFDELQLSHLLKPCLIPAYDISRRRALFFSQHTADKPASDFYVRSIARAASAAPSYFECEQIQSLSGVSYPLIDGSIFANNPAMCAFTEARKAFPNSQVSAENTLLLSLGTGLPKTQYEYDDVKNWGLASWPRPMLDMTNSAISETVDHQLRTFFTAAGTPNQYLRINPELPIKVEAEMDNASPQNLQALKELGLFVAEEYDEKLDDLVTSLLEGQIV